jgi:hypothetical protein
VQFWRFVYDEMGKIWVYLESSTATKRSQIDDLQDRLMHNPKYRPTFYIWDSRSNAEAQGALGVPMPLGLQDLRARAYVQVVQVMLAPGEQYETDTFYNGQKRVLTQKVVVSGVNEPWDVMKSCHEFCEPLQDERQCIEILLFKNSENYSLMHILWEQGWSKQRMTRQDFLFTNDWEWSRAVASMSQIQAPGGSVDYEQHTHRVPALVTLLSELTRRERTH